jgi:hypothetical protein
MFGVAIASLLFWATCEAYQVRQKRLAMAQVYERKVLHLVSKSMYPGTLSADEERLSSLYSRLASEFWYRSSRPWLPEPSLSPQGLGTPAEELLKLIHIRRNW